MTEAESTRTEIPEEIMERVEAGFQRLRQEGDTFEYVDLDALEMVDIKACILGQREQEIALQNTELHDAHFSYPSFFTAMIRLFGSEDLNVAEAYGFKAECDDEEYIYLDEAWTRRIVKFRETGE